MNFLETDLSGCFIVEPTIFEDSRGYFFESYRLDKINEYIDPNVQFLQDNESKSKYGVVRGLHMQRGKFAQTKLVRVLQGKILDVAVDVRKDSPTFGQHISVELSGENKKQIYIPHGFLHGFAVLSEEAVVSYKCDNYYNKESEDGVNPLSEELNIDWKISKEKMILSVKDETAQVFSKLIPF
jgi:dTDP-4-dehydrorhamnose 3,5-epimerase